MAISVCVGLRASKPRFGVLGRFFFGIAKNFNKMSIASALRSSNAEEFRRPGPAGEDNWKSRMGFCASLSEAIEQTGTSENSTHLVASIEPVFNNLLDCAISERTQLSIQACRLLGNLPLVLGKDILPQLDRFLPTLIRQSANTKAVAQKSASAAISNIITRSPFSHRTLWHVCQAFEDKYTAPKLYAPIWLKLIIENYYPALSPDRDYEIISRAISFGLEEADNNVRVNSRAVFWEYHKIDPTGAENIVAKLNNHAKSALMNDPHNPDKSTKGKSKNQTESATALALIRQQRKEQMKQKLAERNRVVSASTITSQDFATGPLDIGDHKHSSSTHKASVVTAPAPESLPTINKSTSRPIAIHKKGFSHDGHVASVAKKASAIDTETSNPKKSGSTESLRTSQNKKHISTIAEASTARPLLSAPVRRPRIVAKPINVPQSSSRPASRAGVSQPLVPTADPTIRSTVGQKEMKSGSNEVLTSELQNITSKQNKKIPRSELSSPVLIPEGKENANIYKMRKAIDRTSPERIITPIDRNPGPMQPPKVVQLDSDGLTGSHRHHRQELDKEISDMEKQIRDLPPLLKPVLQAVYLTQDDEKGTQMYHAYPTLNHDGAVEQARRAFQSALQYLSKDALDYMGFRKLRKLLEQFGRNLIIDRSQYDQLFSELVPRLGTFEELLTQPLHEITNEGHPRYIRQAVLTMINILISAFPYAWSSQYQGPALASMMIARCAYSVNSELHEGAPYINNLTIVNQINSSIQIVVEFCQNPVETMDSVLQVLSAAEDFLVRNAPHDSESQKSWASFNPYSKINRLRTENMGIFHNIPTNLDTFELEDPKPLPMKLPLLMEAGLRIIKALINKAANEEFKLGEEREDVLADLARHLMSSYNIIIRREVMAYCQVLYRFFESEERFWIHFANDSERNLLHYYLEKGC